MLSKLNNLGNNLGINLNLNIKFGGINKVGNKIMMGNLHQKAILKSILISIITLLNLTLIT